MKNLIKGLNIKELIELKEQINEEIALNKKGDIIRQLKYVNKAKQAYLKEMEILQEELNDYNDLLGYSDGDWEYISVDDSCTLQEDEIIIFDEDNFITFEN